IGFKIREHTLAKVPYLLVIGDKAVENRTIALRTRNGQELGSLPLDAIVARFRADEAEEGRIVTERWLLNRKRPVLAQPGRTSPRRQSMRTFARKKYV